MRWQYKRIELGALDLDEPAFEKNLNALGADGWELVTTLVTERHGHSKHAFLLFKRPAAD